MPANDASGFCDHKIFLVNGEIVVTCDKVGGAYWHNDATDDQIGNGQAHDEKIRNLQINVNIVYFIDTAFSKKRDKMDAELHF